MRGCLGFLSLVALPAALWSCADLGNGPGICTDEIGLSLTPTDTTIHVGQSFVARLSLTTCGGSVPLVDTLSFASTAPDVAGVDSLSGVVTGVAAGVADIDVFARHYRVAVRVSVDVIRPGP
jgi:hypothetical protein